MADTAAHLVDRVLPEVAVRQWVLSLPYAVRFMLAYDRHLCTKVLETFLRALLSWHRYRGREWLGFERAESGTVTVIQRFGSAINLNVHFHVLALDGVYAPVAEEGGPRIRFHALPPPETEEVGKLLRVVAHRILRVLVGSGRLREEEDGYAIVWREEDESGGSESVLGKCQAASVRSRIALGAHAGRRVTRLGDEVDADWGEEGSGQPSRGRCAEYAGFSLHADVRVSGHDRERLERLCRYIARPAIATERLTQSEDGRVSYLLRKRWRDGTTGFVFEPEELIEKLVALIPAPRGHLVRYHGVLAARSRWRAEVVRDRRVEAGPDAEVRRTPVPSEGDAEGDAGAWEPAEENRELRERRLTWSELMLRVFAEDVLKCTRCGGRRKLIAVITQADVIVAFLASLGLPTRAPPMAPVRPADPGEEAHP